MAEKYNSKHSGTTIDGAVDQVSTSALNNLETSDKTVVGAINELKTNKQNVITPGTGIQIVDDTISTKFYAVLGDEE